MLLTCSEVKTIKRQQHDAIHMVENGAIFASFWRLYWPTDDSLQACILHPVASHLQSALCYFTFLQAAACRLSPARPVRKAFVSSSMQPIRRVMMAIRTNGRSNSVAARSPRLQRARMLSKGNAPRRLMRAGKSVPAFATWIVRPVGNVRSSFRPQRRLKLDLWHSKRWLRVITRYSKSVIAWKPVRGQ